MRFFLSFWVGRRVATASPPLSPGLLHLFSLLNRSNMPPLALGGSKSLSTPFDEDFGTRYVLFSSFWVGRDVATASPPLSPGLLPFFSFLN